MSENYNPRKMRAYGALDDNEGAWVVIEPQVEDPRLQREAYPVKGSIEHAVEIAKEFNAHGSYIFRGSGPVTGAAIPQLHLAKDE